MFRFAYVLLLLLLTYQFVVQVTNSLNVFPREGPSPYCVPGPPKRTLLNIMWQCLSTTIICAWAALHPNIPPQEGPLKGGLRRLELMMWTIIAPEILPCWAANQRLAAKTVKDVYNGAKGYTEDGIWKTLKACFSLYEITDTVNPAWTLKHGHFLIMGGIHLVEPVNRPANSTSAAGPGTEQGATVVNVEPRNTSSVGADTEQGHASSENPPEPDEGRETILTLEMLRELVKDPDFKIRLTEAEITRMSKGDALSKAIFMLQSSWFILQCIARHYERLGLTQLELATLALASLNGITFILWWDKPLGAQTIVRVYMKRELSDEERNTRGRGNSMRSGLIRQIQKLFEDCLNEIRDIALRQAEGGTFTNWLIIFPLAILTLLLFPIVALIIAFVYTICDLVLGDSTSFPVDATHVPTFYVPKHQSSFHIFIFMLSGSLFGIVHCAGGWSLPFPTYQQQKLWRVACLDVAVVPIGSTLILVELIDTAVKWFLRCIGSSHSHAREELGTILIFFFMAAYACARLILLGQALALLRHLPPSAFIAVDWSQFYPHFL